MIDQRLAFAKTARRNNLGNEEHIRACVKSLNDTAIQPGKPADDQRRSRDESLGLHIREAIFDLGFASCEKIREIRLAFLAAVARFQFRVRAIVMDKSRIYGRELRSSKESFYRYAVKTVLKHNQGRIRNARLKIDGHGDREFRRELRAYLSREVRAKDGDPPVIRDLKIVDSSRNVLIQLADMVAGTLRRHADGLKDDRELYRKAIAKRLENVWDFGTG